MQKCPILFIKNVFCDSLQSRCDVTINLCDKRRWSHLSSECYYFLELCGMLQFLQKRWVYHTAAWLFIGFAVPEFYFDETDISGSLIAILWNGFFIFLPPLIFAVYSAFYVKEKYLLTQQYVKFVVSILIITFISSLIYHFEYFLCGDDYQMAGQDVQNIFFIILMAIGLQYFKRGIINQYQLKELQAKNAEIELVALKTQLNPHFLFNTLNNIYAVNQSSAEKGSEMIMGLADVMRYHLRFYEAKTINLADEIQFLESYIELEQLRLQDNCQLEIDFPTAVNSAKIAPLLLLTFIENAFKHGTHPLQPCFIKMSLKVKKDVLHFYIENSIIHNKKTVKTQFGIENTRKRLQLIYPNQHQLTITSTAEKHAVKLTITL